MSRRALLRLYPHRWRARYGDEFLALLDQQRITPLVLLDILLGALDAHLRPYVAPAGTAIGGRAMAALAALRTTALTVFCAYSAFALAGGAFYGMVDDSPFVPAMQVHFPLLLTWLTVEAGAAVTAVAVVAGGLPIALATVAYALAHRRRDILMLLAVPFLAFGVVATFIALLGAISLGWLPAPFPIANRARGEALNAGTVAIIVLNDLFFLLASVASVAALAAAVARCEIRAQRFRVLGARIVLQPYRFALVPARLTALAMALALAGVIAWGFVARHVAPVAFTTPILVGWLTIILTMALATLVATLAVLSARRLTIAG